MVKHENRNGVIRSLSDIPEKKRRKMLLGSLMIKVFSGRAQKITAGSIKSSWGSFDRMLRNGLFAKAFREGDFERQRALFSNYWALEADGDVEVWQNRFEHEFLGHNVVLIDALEAVLNHHALTRLYELGCGHGQVLEYLVDRFDEIEEFVGIDISEEQIAKNKTNTTNPKMDFVAADAVQWVVDEAKPQSIFLTNGGVLEYFLQEEIKTIFDHISSNLSPAIVGLIETLGEDHNLDAEPQTMLYGREMAFSHNYPHLLKEAGFTINYMSEQTGTEEHGGGRWIRVLASVGLE